MRRRPPRDSTARALTLVAVVALAAGAAPSAQAQAPVPAPFHSQSASYALDPAHTHVHWEVLHFNTSTARGRFDAVSGSVMLDPAAGRGEVSIAVETASISTGAAVFDKVLRGSDFLAVDRHPTAWFTARRVRFDGDRPADISGELTLRGVSQPLTLRAMRFSCHADAERGQDVCGGDFGAELRRADYGITFGLPFVGGDVRLQIQVEGVRIPAAQR